MTCRMLSDMMASRSYRFAGTNTSTMMANSTQARARALARSVGSTWKTGAPVITNTPPHDQQKEREEHLRCRVHTDSGSCPVAVAQSRGPQEDATPACMALTTWASTYLNRF